MSKRQHHSEPFADIVDHLEPVVGEPNPDAGTWPTPIHDRRWVDDAGQIWRMRGDTTLDAKRFRRLSARSDVRVLHRYGMHPMEVTGAERIALLVRIRDFFEGIAPPMSTFNVAEFRDEDRAVMLVVEESC